MGGWVVWKGFEPILDKLGTVGSCLMEVGGDGDLRLSKTDYFFPSMLLETQMRTIKDDQFVMIITQGMPIPWSEVLLRWRMHKLVLCNRGWLCSAWLEKLDGGWVVGTIGIRIGIGRGGIATGIAKQSTSIGSPVLCCCISPWGRRQIENVRNIRTFTLSFSSSLLWEGFRKNVKHCFSILWANSTSIPNWKFQNCPQY